MKQKLKHNLNKYVENGKLEQGLYKVSDKIRDKKGKIILSMLARL
ncbi:hypothetical protein ABGB00_00200 [Staphylococcus saprophyticus]